MYRRRGSNPPPPMRPRLGRLAGRSGGCGPVEQATETIMGRKNKCACDRLLGEDKQGTTISSVRGVPASRQHRPHNVSRQATLPIAASFRSRRSTGLCTVDDVSPSEACVSSRHRFVTSSKMTYAVTRMPILRSLVWTVDQTRSAHGFARAVLIPVEPDRSLGSVLSCFVRFWGPLVDVLGPLVDLQRHRVHTSRACFRTSVIASPMNTSIPVLRQFKVCTGPPPEYPPPEPPPAQERQAAATESGAHVACEIVSKRNFVYVFCRYAACGLLVLFHRFLPPPRSVYLQPTSTGGGA